MQNVTVQYCNVISTQLSDGEYSYSVEWGLVV